MEFLILSAVLGTGYVLNKNKKDDAHPDDINVDSPLYNDVDNMLEPNRKLIRKSIVANIDIKKGQLINESMLGIKRPGSGIPPSEFNKLIGKIAVRDIDKNRLIDYNDLRND